MALTKKISTLVDKLISLSRDGKLAWEETVDENTFLTAVSGFGVDISKAGVSPFSDYRLRVSDQVGKTLEDVRVKRSGADSEDWEKIDELFEIARRNARDVDAALTTLISSLEKI